MVSMFPLGHLAFGYLCYFGYTQVRSRISLTRREVFVLAIATQTPDVIDKPLTAIGFLHSGRSLAHSLVTWALLSAILIAIAFLMDSWWCAQPFIIGYLSHIVGDAIPSLISGRITPEGGGYLLWPWLFDPPTYTLWGYPGFSELSLLFQEGRASIYLTLLSIVVLFFNRYQIKSLKDNNSK